MSDFQKGDRVVIHERGKWSGVGGTVRHVDNNIGFALVVPDTGLTPGFDRRFSTIDLHFEKGAKRARLAINPGPLKVVKDRSNAGVIAASKVRGLNLSKYKMCRNCESPIKYARGRWIHLSDDVDCFEGAEP